jgi:hypothetical protein
MLEDERRALAFLELKRSVRIAAPHLDRRLGLERDARTGALNSTPARCRSARCRSRPKPNRGAHSSSNRIRPRTPSTRRINRSRRTPSRPSPTGMKSWTSQTPSGVRKRVISTLVSGKYSCLFCTSPPAGRSAKWPTTVGVEQRREDARRVKPRGAVPVDGSVHADERHRMQIPDHTMVGDRRIACSAHRAGARLLAACGTPSRSRRWSPTRRALAIVVSPGLTALEEGKKLASTT